MHVALALVQVLFATNAVIGKLALRELSPIALLTIRAPLAVAVFWALRVVVSRRSTWQPLARGDLPLVAAAGLIGVTINQMLFFAGLARTNATNAVVINATIPVFTVAFSVALGREQATARRLGGLLLALAGALLVTLLGRGGPTLRLELGTGELCLLANSASYALYLVLSRPLFQRYRTDTVITWAFAFGALGVLPFGAAPVAAELPRTSATGLAAAGYIVLGPTVGAYFLNGYALRRATASLVAVYIYAQPAIAAVLAAWLLDEHVALITLVGALLIGCGIALVSRR